MDLTSNNGSGQRVTAVKKRKGKPVIYDIYVDDELAAEVTEDLLVRYRILPGRSVTSAECRQWTEESAASIAYYTALTRLDSRARSSGELRMWLKEKGYQPEIVEEVIERCTQAGYLNDQELASSIVSYRIGTQKMGRLRVAEELRQKGFSAIHIEQALDQFEQKDDEGEWQRALAAASKKWDANYKSAEERKRKTGMYLLRRGYGHAVVLRVLEHLESDSD